MGFTPLLLAIFVVAWAAVISVPSALGARWTARYFAGYRVPLARGARLSFAATLTLACGLVVSALSWRWLDRSTSAFVFPLGFLLGYWAQRAVYARGARGLSGPKLRPRDADLLAGLNTTLALVGLPVAIAVFGA